METQQATRCGFTELHGIKIPYIMRNNKPHLSVRMIEMKILSQFPSDYPAELVNREPLRSHFLTEHEVLLFNRINSRVCKNEYGDEPFSKQDLIVDYAEFDDFFSVVRKMYPHVDINKNHQLKPGPVEIQGGWIQVNNTLVPYVFRHPYKYVPLQIIQNAACLLTEVEIEGQCALEKECEYLTGLCKDAKLVFEFDKDTKLINLNLLSCMRYHKNVIIKDLGKGNPFTHAEYIEDITSNNTMASLPTSPQFLHTAQGTVSSVCHPGPPNVTVNPHHSINTTNPTTSKPVSNALHDVPRLVGGNPACVPMGPHQQLQQPAPARSQQPRKRRRKSPHRHINIQPEITYPPPSNNRQYYDYYNMLGMNGSLASGAANPILGNHMQNQLTLAGAQRKGVYPQQQRQHLTSAPSLNNVQQAPVVSQYLNGCSPAPSPAIPSPTSANMPTPSSTLHLQQQTAGLRLQQTFTEISPPPPPPPYPGQMPPPTSFMQQPTMMENQPLSRPVVQPNLPVFPHFSPPVSVNQQKTPNVTIKADAFLNKQISCLHRITQSGVTKLVLVEAICKVFFRTNSANEFIEKAEKGLGIKLDTCTADEEQAFIKYYTLNVARLQCTKLISYGDFERFYNPLTFLLAQSNENVLRIKQEPQEEPKRPRITDSIDLTLED